MSDVKPVAWAAFEGSELICVHHDCDKCIELARLVMAPNKPTFDVVPLTTVLALQAEIEAMRKDVERLEYLANDMQDMTFNGVEVLDFIEEDCDWPKAWRKAIDAAIAKEKQP